MHRLQYSFEYETGHHFKPFDTIIKGACYMCYPDNLTKDESEELKKPLRHKIYFQRYDFLMNNQINPFYYGSYNQIKIDYEF